MIRTRQNFDDIIEALMPVEASWLDQHAEEVITALKDIPAEAKINEIMVQEIFDKDFNVGFTVARLFLDLSKDEFTIRLKEKFTGPGGAGVSRYRKDRDYFIKVLADMSLLAKMNAAIRQPLTKSMAADLKQDLVSLKTSLQL